MGKPKQVIILKGLPASGKSTWAKEKVKTSQGTFKRINKDDLRAMVDAGQWSKPNEKFVLKIRDHFIADALLVGLNVIVDDTNIYQGHEDDIRLLVKIHNQTQGDNVQVELKVFDTGVNECIERDKKRENSVGADVIVKMAKQWHPAEHADVIPELDMDTLMHNGLPWCIIYDLDGTAAIMGDRSAYDAKDCDVKDRCNHALFGVLATMSDHPSSEMAFIAMSGRSDEFKPETERFIKKHEFPCDALHMRKAGDQRKDSVIKGELFDEHIRGKYNVLVVFDDRNQMVDFWRKEVGVPCFQVNYGDF